MKDPFPYQDEMNGDPADPTEVRLRELLLAYRDACPDPEPSRNFMPGLWQKIEAAQGVPAGFHRWLRWFASASAAIVLILGGLSFAPSAHRSSPVYSSTYVEVLVAQHVIEAVEYSDPAPRIEREADRDLL